MISVVDVCTVTTNESSALQMKGNVLMGTEESTATTTTTNPRTPNPDPTPNPTRNPDPTTDLADPARQPGYVAPDWFTRHVFNPIVARCTRWGISLWGSRVLSVPGRVTGEIRSTPVNVLTIDDRRFLVAPRGETQWVLNVRAAGGCTLSVGRSVETVRLRALDDHDKPDVLRPYLRRWKWEVGQFFDGVGADSSDAELLDVARNHPVFEILAT